MAIVSSHTLNSVDGTHAGGIAVTLTRISADGSRTDLFNSATDDGGRFSEELDASLIETDATYEMVLATGPYFDARSLSVSGGKFLREVVVRFEMPDATARYHIPFMLAPHSYSVWFSS